jgi:hypothetical protein
MPEIIIGQHILAIPDIHVYCSTIHNNQNNVVYMYNKEELITVIHRKMGGIGQHHI